MHSHHLASMHHVNVLDAYSEQLETIPKEVLQEQVQAIQKETVASRKWLASLPRERLAGQAEESVKGIQQSHAQTIKAAKAITAELQNPNVNYTSVSNQVNQMSRSLRSGESHIHDAYNHWKLNPIHRRLHPGT
ncbi:hypothetical protein FYK55_09495 [Roseiconus nitratireducens]|uniref:Uncharacterized protein n=1 Tax=Roseiconus nitratireducens TaxID=2605748 RepID=A0A5M6DH21_9BACT|nr:hypothetical protein [Roseiconus nitratireducens]KAA5544545.1 hypothetical protein FYK55_09495 [Roseiconus nitratireducens]